MAASPNSIKILETCRVSPAFNPPESAAEFTLPFTYLDAWWFRFPPVERLFFYKLTDSNSNHSFFNSTILPNLKKSLSQTLLHFLPLAAALIWPSDSPLPIISYNPKDAAVSLTVAESAADLTRLSSNDIHDAIESRPYIPDLSVSETEASIISLQITLFPNMGFSIGVANHHAILDGKSLTMFVKAWAFVCRNNIKLCPSLGLPSDLSPVFDRTEVIDPTGLDKRYLNFWSELGIRLGFDSNPRSLKLMKKIVEQGSLVRATFLLTRSDLRMLRERVISQLLGDNKNAQELHLSSFVITCAYTMVCLLKARGGDGNSNIYFVFSADSRNRLDPPIPDNYFGTCVCGHYFVAEIRQFLVESVENAVAMAAGRISGLVKGLEKKRAFDGPEETLAPLLMVEPGGRVVGVAGSTRFGVYESDFGWGRPEKVEITSVDRTGAIALAESRDGAGGVEIGLALVREEMEVFASLFYNGLKNK